ncbi:MAG: MBL fold metallo-hydrolase [Bacteroidales bacterium]|nr:MBL fold metallo-hydrolase [Bacteroidales bacterium]
MTIKYIHHSCFVVENDDAVLVFDYWKDTPDELLGRTLFQTDKQIYFIVSHFHEDHFNPDILNWCHTNGKDPIYLISYDTVKRRHINKNLPAAILHPGENYQDEILKLHAYRSTDVGISILVTLSDGTTIFHTGDLNNWYFPEDDGEHLKITADEMEGMYLSIIKNIYTDIKEIDHVMFPVDPRLGKEAMRGPIQWLSKIDTKHFYPMHFWEDKDFVASNIKAIKEIFPKVDFVF